MFQSYPSIPLSDIKRALISPLSTLGFDPLQGKLICLGLTLVFCSEVVAPRFDEMRATQQMQQDLHLKITEQKLRLEQLGQANQAIIEDEFLRFVAHRKLTGFRTADEYTIAEYLDSQSSDHRLPSR